MDHDQLTIDLKSVADKHGEGVEELTLSIGRINLNISAPMTIQSVSQATHDPVPWELILVEQNRNQRVVL